MRRRQAKRALPGASVCATSQSAAAGLGAKINAGAAASSPRKNAWAAESRCSACGDVHNTRPTCASKSIRKGYTPTSRSGTVFGSSEAASKYRPSSARAGARHWYKKAVVWTRSTRPGLPGPTKVPRICGAEIDQSALADFADDGGLLSVAAPRSLGVAFARIRCGDDGADAGSDTSTGAETGGEQTKMGRRGSVPWRRPRFRLIAARRSGLRQGCEQYR